MARFVVGMFLPAARALSLIFVLMVLLWFECGNWGFLLALLGPDCIRAYPFFGVFGCSVLSLFWVVSSQAGGHVGPPLRFDLEVLLWIGSCGMASGGQGDLLEILPGFGAFEQFFGNCAQF